MNAYNRPVLKFKRLLEETMKKDRMLLMASSVFCLTAIGCSSEPASEVIELEPLPVASTIETEGRPRLVAAARGTADLALLTPDANNQTIGGQAFVMTEIQVMNMADAPIAGLTVEDLWYDNDGNTVSGDTYRHPSPLPPGVEVTVTLQVPRVNGMVNNQYQFSHANGEINPITVDEFPEEDITEESPTE
jgi:hypothetical protein